jgi:hypothetical protein
MQEPFAVQIYREFLGGKTIAELSGELSIPAERIERRLRAAAAYLGVAAPEEWPNTPVAPARSKHWVNLHPASRRG